MNPIEFEKLSQQDRDNLLKTLIVQIFNSLKDEFPMLKSYCKYGAQHFDNTIIIEQDAHSIIFRKKE